MNINDARLGDAEIARITFHPEIPDFRVIADAATAKAIWWVTNYIKDAAPQSEIKDALLFLASLIERDAMRAGIPRRGETP